MKNFFFFNTTIMPNEGIYECKKIATDRAREIFVSICDNGTGYCENFVSAIGHEASAQALNVLMDLPKNGQCIQVNRIPAVMEPGDIAIALKVRGRLPEGQILTIEELEGIGYDLFLIQRLNGANTFAEIEQSATYAGAAPINGTLFRYEYVV